MAVSQRLPRSSSPRAPPSACSVASLPYHSNVAAPSLPSRPVSMFLPRPHLAPGCAAVALQRIQAAPHACAAAWLCPLRRIPLTSACFFELCAAPAGPE
ncbi:hypothetical protein ZWY2020_042994 [Hordeum vulgare]|nr:hypothetical protein ZWY2020_042994 [Hordeum vulgare]